MAGYVGRGSGAEFVLPFAVSAEDRVKAFTKEVEMAAILYLAESGREKGEGHILRKPDEKLVFIAEALYPIWLVPWNGGTLLFDGLGATMHTLTHDSMPDMLAFNRDIRSSAKKSKAYSRVLSRNTAYFKNFTGKEETTIEGLIASAGFIKDFSVYLSEVKQAEKPLTRKAILSPIIGGSEISASVHELSDLIERVDKDARNVEMSMKLVNMKTRERVKAIRREIRSIRKKSSRQIKKVKFRVTRNIGRIQGKYGGKLASVSRRYERRLRLLNKDRVKLQRMYRDTRTELSRCETKIESCKRHKNKAGEIQWRRRLKRIRGSLSATQKNIKNRVKRMEELETAKQLETSKLRIQCDTCISGASRSLRDLEASREAEVKTKRNEITSLERSASQIVNQMNELAKSKKAGLAGFDSIIMPKRKRTRTLVYLPLYLARYEMEGNKRYVVFPPCIVSNLGILTKMKGALGAAKMKAFLQPRSRAITEFLSQVVTLIQKNSMLGKEITDAGIQDSILRRKQLRIGVKRGLKELKDEEWISKEELQTFSKLLYIYA